MKRSSTEIAARARCSRSRSPRRRRARRGVARLGDARPHAALPERALRRRRRTRRGSTSTSTWRTRTTESRGSLDLLPRRPRLAARRRHAGSSQHRALESLRATASTRCSTPTGAACASKARRTAAAPTTCALTPVGTGDTGVSVLPRLGSHYNDDSDPDDRFFVRRYGGGGEIRLRPERLRRRLAPLTQLSFYGSQEPRTGQRQDRYLLDPDEVGARPRRRALPRPHARARPGRDDARRRASSPSRSGSRRASLDVSWQRFRENAPTHARRRPRGDRSATCGPRPTRRSARSSSCPTRIA